MFKNVLKVAAKNFFSAPTVALASFILYLSTLAPGVTGFDSAELASGVHSLGIVHPTGYPLYLLIGKLFSSVIPFGDLALKLNLMSALFASLTVFMLYQVILQVTDNDIASWVGAGFFSIASHFWQMAIVAEVYTLHTFFLALNLYLLIKWRKTKKQEFLFAFALCFGLSLCNHVSSGLFAPAYLWLILSSNFQFIKKWRHWWIAPILFLLGLIPYLYLPIRAMAHPELDYVRTYYNIDLTSLRGLLWMISGKAYSYFAFGYHWDEVFIEIIGFLKIIWRDFLGIGVLLGVIGLAWKKSGVKKVQIVFAFIFFANAIFFINYRVLDKDTMFLPAYLILAIFSGQGIAYLFNIVHDVEGKIHTKISISHLLVSTLILAVFLAGYMNYPWLDMSKDTDRQIVIQEVLETASPNSTIISQWSSAVILEYYQTVAGLRPDLKIINRSRINAAKYYELWIKGLNHADIMDRINQEELNFVHKEILARTVYIIEYDPLYLHQFEYLPEENYFRLSLINQK